MLVFIPCFFLLLLTQTQAGDPCPPKTDLRSCTCHQVLIPNGGNMSVQELLLSRPRPTTHKPPIRTTTDSSTTIILPTTVGPSNGSLYTVVECKVPKTMTALEEAIVSSLHRKAVDKLIVTGVPPSKEHTLVRLPREWLKNTRVKQFEIRDTVLSGDFISYQNPFEGQAQSLQWFTATRCYLSGALTHDTIGTVNTKGLGSLPLVEGVDLSFNLLTVVTDTAFKHPPANLSTVVLSHNSIQKVESGALQHISRLRMVNLSHNLLEDVSRNMIASPAKYLETIDLSRNSLSSLPHDFFHNMPRLKTVIMSTNFLFSLPEKPWATIWDRASEIDLTHNFIACDCNLLWLLKIALPVVIQNSTLAPAAATTQYITGKCSHNVLPAVLATQYDLTELTRDKLVC